MNSQTFFQLYQIRTSSKPKESSEYRGRDLQSRSQDRNIYHSDPSLSHLEAINVIFEGEKETKWPGKKMLYFDIQQLIKLGLVLITVPIMPH